MSTLSRPALFRLGLVATWAFVADLAMRASLRPTRIEHLRQLEPTIEWSRVFLVWGVAAAELLAFAWLVTGLHRATSWATRIALAGLGLLAAAAGAIKLGSHSHMPSESALPGVRARANAAWCLTAASTKQVSGRALSYLEVRRPALAEASAAQAHLRLTSVLA